MYHVIGLHQPKGTNPQAKHWVRGPNDLDQHARQRHPPRQNQGPPQVQVTSAPMHRRCVLHQLHSSTHLLCSWIIWFLFRRLLRRRILSSTDRQTLRRRHNIHRHAVVLHALFPRDAQGRLRFHKVRKQQQTE